MIDHKKTAQELEAISKIFTSENPAHQVSKLMPTQILADWHKDQALQTSN